MWLVHLLEMMHCSRRAPIGTNLKVETYNIESTDYENIFRSLIDPVSL